MENFQVGKFLRETRIRKHVSQEELCGVFCAVSTLSRIERGEQIPGRKMLQLFFERLGVEMPPVDIPISTTEFKRYNLEVQIHNKVAAKNYKIKDLLDEYASLKPKMSLLEFQFHETMLAIYELRNRTKSNEEVLEHFIKAMSVTLPGFTLDYDLSGHLYTRTEITILINISITEYFMGRENEAINRICFLKKYYETNDIWEYERLKSYKLFLFWLSNWTGKAGRIEESLKYAEDGIQECCKQGNLHLFPYFVFNKGYSLAKLGRLQEGKEFLRKAFDMMELTGNIKDKEYGIKDVNKNFGFDFPES